MDCELIAVAGDTVPVIAVFTVFTPVLADVILPDNAPVADVVVLMYNVVAPAFAVAYAIVRLLAKPVLTFVEISKPEGAVTVTSLVNKEPETVKV